MPENDKNMAEDKLVDSEAEATEELPETELTAEELPEELREEAPPPEEFEEVIPIFSGDELEVLVYIDSYDGVTIFDIHNNLPLRLLKLSRILRKLEQAGEIYLLEGYYRTFSE